VAISAERSGRRGPTAMRSRRCRPRGYTLVEMLIYISISSTLVGLGTSLMYTGYRAYQTTDEWRVAVQQRSRLARMFADDVHAATEARLLGAELPLEQQRFELTRPDGVAIVYAWN